MPPAIGSYILANKSSNTYLGIGDDGTSVVLYDKPEKAQKWTIAATVNQTKDGMNIFATLKDGQLRYIAFKEPITSTYHGLVVDPPNSGREANRTEWYIENVTKDTYKIKLAVNHPWTIYVLGSGTPNRQPIMQNTSSTWGEVENWQFQPYDWKWSIDFGADPSNLPSLFNVPTLPLRMIAEEMLESFRSNLKKDTHPPFMIPTYVTDVPDGTETGTFLALVLSDTFVRVSKIELFGDGSSDASQKRYNLTPALVSGPATALFTYIAQSVGNALREWDMEGSYSSPLIMGMAFPFPVEKTAINSGSLLHWTKGVSASGAVGKDVVKLLQASLDQERLAVKCVALLNDTTATLLTRAYESGGCEIGAIFGTGTNGAYVEEAANVTSLAKKEGRMILNTEWGGFTSKVLPRTRFDNRIDRESINPGEQAFEKLGSAMYLGEQVRLMLLHFIDIEDAGQTRPLFNRHSSKRLNTPFGIDVPLMREIEAATDTSITTVLVKKLGIPQDSIIEEDRNKVKLITRLVARRAARLSACTLAATLILMGRAAFDGGITTGGQIGVEGSLVQNYPKFMLDLREALRELIGENVEKNVYIGVVKDGSDIGAALCAYQAHKQTER